LEDKTNKKSIGIQVVLTNFVSNVPPSLSSISFKCSSILFHFNLGKAILRVPQIYAWWYVAYHSLLKSLLFWFAELQHLGHGDGDKYCQAQSLEKSRLLENKRNNSNTIVESSIKKLKMSSGNGPDDVDELRNVTTLQDLTNVKGKKGNSKWAPTTKKLAKSWDVSA